MKTSQEHSSWSWIGWLILTISVAVIISYLIWGRPAEFITRFELVAIALGVLGIPLGIKFGSQDKFWT